MDPQTAAASDPPTPDAGRVATAESTSELATGQSTPASADVSTIGVTLMSEQPAVQEHAISQAAADAAAQSNHDVNAQPFNAAIHAVNADGSPRKTAKGAWALKRGKKAGAAQSGTASPKLTIPGGAGITVEQANKEQLARRGGAGAANLLMAVCVGLGGTEWQPRADAKTGLDEKAMLEGVFGDYFVATNKTDLPPGWALVAGCAMYALPRFGMPQTQSRLKRVKNWVGAKIVQFRARRAGLKVKVETESEATLVKDEMQHRESFRAMHVPGMSK